MESFEVRMKRAEGQRMCQLITMALEVRKDHGKEIEKIEMEVEGLTDITVWLKEGGFVQVLGPDAFDLIHPGITDPNWKGYVCKHRTGKTIDGIIMGTQEQATEFIKDMIKWLSK